MGLFDENSPYVCTLLCVLRGSIVSWNLHTLDHYAMLFSCIRIRRFFWDRERWVAI